MLVSSMLLFALGGAIAQDDAAWTEYRPMKILYAGYPEGSREVSYLEFLSQWFETVDSISLSKLNAKVADPYDVVIADWTSHYGKDGYDKDVPPIGTVLDSNFVKPVIAINFVVASLRPAHKLNWL